MILTVLIYAFVSVSSHAHSTDDVDGDDNTLKSETVFFENGDSVAMIKYYSDNLNFNFIDDIVSKFWSLCTIDYSKECYREVCSDYHKCPDYMFVYDIATRKITHEFLYLENIGYKLGLCMRPVCQHFKEMGHDNFLCGIEYSTNLGSHQITKEYLHDRLHMSHLTSTLRNCSYPDRSKYQPNFVMAFIIIVFLSSLLCILIS